ncbi:hypothetical protein FR483_n489L [Paramecium bursaria Chlorella virus FR483]|uniref:Uncharacterized protein n489L n=1 Tax=Paramecium bursaria Chlorella virus FR483 TaxID=399781 RepID=A7J7J3_PBCVF|nr:hypothetical protein FR483_n489L [Paramecium bursaria Chlorella virus FR483]ABT15774.1 hypothetical protein FR483_n489L [Paramecium bursaria Chlorella virus FR483]
MLLNHMVSICTRFDTDISVSGTVWKKLYVLPNTLKSLASVLTSARSSLISSRVFSTSPCSKFSISTLFGLLSMQTMS